MKHVTLLTPWLKTANHNAMEVAADYPATWTDITGQPDLDIINGLPQFVAFGEVSDAQATAIQSNSKYVVLAVTDAPVAGQPAPVPADLTTPQVSALKTALSSKTHSDVAALVTDATVAPLVIAERLVEAQKRPPWRVGLHVAIGEVYQYQGNLYEVIQAHTTQSDWTPPVAKALWKRFYEPSDDPWPWVQPVGGHDAYPVGARVTFGGYTWRNDIPANVWQPGVTGWTNLTPPPATPDWTTGVAYKVGDVVLYQGNSYRCLQAHTSIQTWNPVATINVLWVRI